MTYRMTAAAREHLTARRDEDEDPSWDETMRRVRAALDRTSDGDEFLVRDDFMDDDEVPEESWTDAEQIVGTLEYYGMTHLLVD